MIFARSHGLDKHHDKDPKELAAILKANRKKRKEQMAQSTTEAGRKRLALDYESFSPPLRPFIYFCYLCDQLANNTYFGNYMLCCILCAGALVGASITPGVGENLVVVVLNQVVLYSFALEVLLKILGEGLHPYRYFMCSEWTWNLFDFFVVLFSFPIIPSAGGQVKLLRLVRLMRLGKVFRRVPRLHMIVMGIVNSIKSVMYIVLLVVLVFYVYAIVGVIFLKSNDSYNFRSIEIAMMSLFRIATLDGWGELMYLNIYGCDTYLQGDYTTNPYLASNKLGGQPMWCQTRGGQPVFTVVFFISFIWVSSYCVLPLFIGAVADGMSECMITLRDEREAKKSESDKERVHAVALMYGGRSKLTRRQLRHVQLVEKAFRGNEMDDEIIKAEPSSWLGRYQWLSYRCQDLQDNVFWKTFVLIVIILAGIIVGIDTDPVLAAKLHKTIDGLSFFIQATFTFECVVNICAEEFQPWRYFYDNWNIFDILVVIVCWAPTGSSGAVTMLRLLRLLRVLKLAKQFTELQLIVSSLLSSVVSIGFVTILVFLFYYFWAIVGNTFFGENDPWHFGNLPMAMFMQLEIGTWDNWSSVMNQNQYGCAQNSANNPIGTPCNESQPQFALAVFYFVIANLVDGYILLTLFIGVIGMEMEEAKYEQKTQLKIEKRAQRIAEVEHLSTQKMQLYSEIFAILNFSNSSRIGLEEIKLGVGLARIVVSEEGFAELWRRLDRNRSRGVDFSEFVEFMLDLRSQNQEEHRQKLSVEGDQVVKAEVVPRIAAHGAIKVKRRQFRMLRQKYFAENYIPVEPSESAVDQLDVTAASIIHRRKGALETEKSNDELDISTSVPFAQSMSLKLSNFKIPSFSPIGDSKVHPAPSSLAEESPSNAVDDNVRVEDQLDPTATLVMGRGNGAFDAARGNDELGISSNSPFAQSMPVRLPKLKITPLAPKLDNAT